MKFFPESWVPDPDKKFNQDDQNIINKIIEKLLEEDKELKLTKIEDDKHIKEGRFQSQKVNQRMKKLRNF